MKKIKYPIYLRHQCYVYKLISRFKEVSVHPDGISYNSFGTHTLNTYDRYIEGVYQEITKKEFIEQLNKTIKKLKSL